MNKQIRHLCAICAILFITLNACKSDSDGPDMHARTRTVIVYMVADNSLSGNSYDDIAEMKRGASSITGGRMIVYHHPSDNAPRLIEITPQGNETVVRAYPAGQSSVSAASMRQVISDARNAAPADSYALVLWSHANGWLFDDGVIDETPPASPLSFGEDGPGPDNRMSITSLAEALGGNTFDFIYFDCCHMATIEVAYELRHLTPWIIASPTELEVDGMPYHLNIPLFFARQPDLRKMIDNTFGIYNNPYTWGCSISLIATDGLERLASVSRKALGRPQPENYTPVKYYRNVVMKWGIFDMRHYYEALTAGNARLAAEWSEAFNKVVRASLSTSTVFTLDASEFSGLGCNIVNTDHPIAYYGFDRTQWARDVVIPAMLQDSSSQPSTSDSES